MVRFILLFILGYFAGWLLVAFMKFISETIDFRRNSSEKIKVKKRPIDYWYEKPHYFILPCGEKINLSEYFTYEEYNEIRGDEIRWKNWLNYINNQFVERNRENLNTKENNKILY